MDNIERRKISEALLSLAIVHNPFSEDPNALFRELRGNIIYSNGFTDSIDRNSVENLKKKLSGKSNLFKVK